MLKSNFCHKFGITQSISNVVPVFVDRDTTNNWLVSEHENNIWLRAVLWPADMGHQIEQPTEEINNK